MVFQPSSEWGHSNMTVNIFGKLVEAFIGGWQASYTMQRYYDLLLTALTMLLKAT